MPTISPDSQPMVYAGFWRRLGAFSLDMVIMLPVLLALYWGNEHSRLFRFYTFLPLQAFFVFYQVWLVQRLGGTPGKRLMKLRIARVNGSMIGTREAVLRALPGQLLSIGSLIALMAASLNLTDAQFQAGVVDRWGRVSHHQLLLDQLPPWGRYWDKASYAWGLVDLAIMLINDKRRALHDFLAGTVVLREDPKGIQETLARLDPRMPEFYKGIKGIDPRVR